MVWWIGLLWGCTGADPACSAGRTLVFTEDQDYRTTTDLTVQSQDVGARRDVYVDWSALTEDLRGRELDPADVEYAWLVAFSLEPEEVLAFIETNDLSQKHIRDYREFVNDGDSGAHLSEFSIFGNAFDPATELRVGDGTWTWAVTLLADLDGRQDLLSTQFLVPVDDEANDTLFFSDDSTQLDFDVAFSGETLQAPAATDVVLDFSALASPDVDRVLVGRVDGTLADVEAQFLRLDEAAAALYHADVDGEALELALATDSDGDAFPGFSTEGTWLVGLECLTCTSPAPVAMTVVDVCE